MMTKSNNSILLNKRIPLTSVIDSNHFLVLKIQPISEYENGKRTDTILGYSYECVDLIDYERFNIKIKGQTSPLMTNEDLQQLRENGEKVIVEFKNPTVYMFYSTTNNGYQDSFSADDVSLVSRK